MKARASALAGIDERQCHRSHTGEEVCRSEYSHADWDGQCHCALSSIKKAPQQEQDGAVLERCCFIWHSSHQDIFLSCSQWSSRNSFLLPSLSKRKVSERFFKSQTPTLDTTTYHWCVVGTSARSPCQGRPGGLTAPEIPKGNKALNCYF